MARGQPCLGLPHPKVHLSPQQHVLLLFRVLNSLDSRGEVPGRLPPHHLQGHVCVQVQEAEVRLHF